MTGLSHEELLVEQAGRGDRRAFTELMSLHRDELRRLIELRLDDRIRSRVDPSDVVQETQLEVFRRLDDYLTRRPMPFRLWLRKTAYDHINRLHVRHISTERRSLNYEVPLADRSSAMLVGAVPRDSSSPSHKIIKSESAGQVRQALAQLEATDREILLMRYVEGLSNKDIALLLELSSDAVSKRHGRALLRLQRLLMQLDEGGIQ